MAILSRLRGNKVVLIGVIGLALFAFILMDVLSKSGNPKSEFVGEINGETINREAFANEVESYKARAGARATNSQAINYAWDKMVNDQIYTDQIDKAGIVVGGQDIWNSIIAMPYFANGPEFKNEAGLFDEEKVKEFIANLKDEALGAPAGSAEQNIWQNWLTTEAGIKENLQRTTLSSLVSAGLGASLKEGERMHKFGNDKVTSKYVYVPYTTVADSLINISTAEYTTYIKNHAKEFQVEESRDLRYVKFDIVASEQDKEDIKATVAALIEDNKNNGALGLKNATNLEEFMEDAKNDLPASNTRYFKSKLAKTIADDVFAGNIGDVVGPYEENGYFKISKITAISKIPDSVKSSHIIVPFAGTTRSTSTKTKEAARKTVDSIFRLVRRSSAKFTEVADEINTDGSKGKGGDIGWITSDMAFSPNFDVTFADFIFENKEGAIDVVETAFGFHIIKIEEQKNIDTAIELATLSREIVASAETESKFYQDAETFTADLVNGKDINELAKDGSLTARSAVAVKALDENIVGIPGNQRQIITWAFDTDINDVKRFEVDNGHIVAILTKNTPKGLAPVSSVINRIRPTLLKDKKAALIADKMNGTTLSDIANQNGVTVKTASNVNLLSPTISGVGAEPAVVGAMMGATVNSVITNIQGVKGVFAIETSSIEDALELPNYNSSRNGVATKLKGRTSQILSSLKSSYDIEDNRADMY